MWKFSSWAVEIKQLYKELPLQPSACQQRYLCFSEDWWQSDVVFWSFATEIYLLFISTSSKHTYSLVHEGRKKTNTHKLCCPSHTDWTHRKLIIINGTLPSVYQPQQNYNLTVFSLFCWTIIFHPISLSHTPVYIPCSLHFYLFCRNHQALLRSESYFPKSSADQDLSDYVK